jgi:peptidoglycan hydrolase CwlO-like protein
MSKDRNMNLIRQSASSLSIGALGSAPEEDLNYQLKKAQLEINRINELKEDIEIKCKRLDKQVSELQEEKMSLMSEMELLRVKLQREDSNRNDPT